MIILTGSRGVVGTPLLARLMDSEHRVCAVSRSDRSEEMAASQSSRNFNEAKGLHHLQWDMLQPIGPQQSAALENSTVLLHCAPIWYLPPHVYDLYRLGVRRIVAFSSTSVISKQGSNNPQEQLLVAQLSEAEQSLVALCTQHNIDLTILRPSMIYGYGLDQNISKIAQMAQRFRVLPLVGRAQGLRQPVHADDLARCCIENIANSKSFQKAYNLAGAERISYREMCERIFIGLNLKPRIIRIPLCCYRLALWLASKLTRFSYTPEMADRMNQDLVYDIELAEQELNFKPQGFLQQPYRDLIGGSNPTGDGL